MDRKRGNHQYGLTRGGEYSQNSQKAEDDSERNFVFLRASKEELSEMIGRSQEQFNDLKDMELSNTTVHITETISPFLGVLDDCIHELERSQNKIFQKIGEEKDEDIPDSGEEEFDITNQELGQSLIGQFGIYEEGEPPNIFRKTHPKRFVIPSQNRKLFDKVDFSQDLKPEKHQTKKQYVSYRTPQVRNRKDFEENFSNESLNLIPKRTQELRRKTAESFYKDTNIKVMFAENKQLRMLMSDYLREIDQLRYAYTRLRRKYGKMKDRCEGLEIEVKRLNEINKLLRSSNLKKNQIFQNFCIYPKNPKKSENGISKLKYQNQNKLSEFIQKKKKHRKIKSQESLKRIKPKISTKNSQRKIHYSKSNEKKTIPSNSNSESIPIKKQIARLIHKPVKARSIFKNPSFQDKINWIRKQKRVSGSLNLNHLQKNQKNFSELVNPSLERINSEKVFENFKSRKKHSRESILKNFHKVKILKKKILKDKNERLMKRLAEGRDPKQQQSRLDVESARQKEFY